MPLSPEDAALVLRRAAELDTPSLSQYDALDEQVVRDAAREVGLSEAAVDRAVAEWRGGILAPLPDLSPDRFAGLLATVSVHAELALTPEAALRQLDVWLKGQWFERRRTRGPETEWRPRRGPLARVRRSVDLHRTLRLSGVGRLRVCVAPAAEGARVRLVADLGETRTALLAGLVAAPALVGGAGATLATVLPAGSALPELLLALPAAVGTGGLGWLGARGVLGRCRATVAEELERGIGELADLAPRRALHERAARWALHRLSGQPR